MIHWVFFMVLCLVVVSADDDGPAVLELSKGFHPHPPRWSVEYSFAYCKWKGVECNPKNHRVTSINISGLSLGGVISPAISSLPELSEVYVQNNKLSGEIPKLPKQVELVYRPGNPRLRHSNNTTGIIIGSVVGGALTLIIISVVVYLLRKSTLENRRTGDDHRGLISGDTVRDDGHLYSIESLRRATNDFSQDNILGEGGFGVVYKGVQRDGTMIAVKRKDFGVVDERARPTFLVSS